MFRADAAGLRKLGAELRKSHPAVYRQVQRAVLEEARKVAETARENASWSSRIPGTVKAGTRGGLTAVVRAGGTGAPHAAAYEHAGREGTFRHPVHADPTKTRDEWTWVSEQARPFLHPAALQRLPMIVEALGHAVVAAIDEQVRKA